MKTLLKIRASIYGTEGQSSQLADRFAEYWRLNNPGGRVVTRDLTAESMPHLTAETFRAFRAEAKDRSPEQQAAVDLSDTLIRELEGADVIALAVPMYNFSIPSTLKAYFDHIGRAGVTFRYTAEGPEGLLKGKRTYLLVARGGSYAANSDTQIPYLKQFLGFIGLTDIECVVAEGLAFDEQTRQTSVAAANATMAKLMPAAAAAA